MVTGSRSGSRLFRNHANEGRGQNGAVKNRAVALLNRPSLSVPALVEGAPDFSLHDPADPLVRVLDLGLTRGDGVFETISVGAGHPQALEAHIRRFARSAALLDLPEPDADTWIRAVRAVAAELQPMSEAYVKTILTRGVEGDGRPTGWAFAEPAADFRQAREQGIRVVLLDRGYRSDVAATSPWLLQGSKNLSYAVNRAVLREAARRDADDVVLVSSDGYLLEGSTSNLLLRVGDRLVTPATDHGILAGTSQADLFRHASSLGLSAEYARLRRSDLESADAAWLISSVRHAAPIRQIEGADRTVDVELTASINAFLLGRTE